MHQMFTKFGIEAKSNSGSRASLPRKLISVGVLILISFGFSSIQAEEAPIPHSMFAEAAQTWDVPVDLTKAIAKVESGLSPWALNIEGQSIQSSSKDEALAKAREADAAGRSFDVGPMQVNNFWLKKYGIPLEAAFDPLANIYLGSWILKKELEQRGNTWTAVGAYHSPNEKRSREYVERVKAALAKGPVAEKSKKQISPARTSKTSVAVTPLIMSPQSDTQKIATANPFVQRLNKE